MMNWKGYRDEVEVACFKGLTEHLPGGTRKSGKFAVRIDSGRFEILSEDLIKKK
jgi:hypothetical protein